MIEFLWNIDSGILLWIHNMLRNDICTPLMKFITSLGDSGYIWIIITIILLISKKTRKVGIMSAMALIGSLLINNLILKNLVARTRPYEVITDIELLIERAKDLSFPSGHSASSFAAAFVLYKELPKKYGIPALVLAALISFSRLYIGIHYPSDVIFGIIDGILIAVLVRKIYYKMQVRNRNER